MKNKAFYAASFKWTFTDYGPTYTAFSNSGLEGGFEKSDTQMVNGALIVLYFKDLEIIKNRILKAGGNDYQRYIFVSWWSQISFC